MALAEYFCVYREDMFSTDSNIYFYILSHIYVKDKDLQILLTQTLIIVNLLERLVRERSIHWEEKPIDSYSSV